MGVSSGTQFFGIISETSFKPEDFLVSNFRESFESTPLINTRQNKEVDLLVETVWS